MARWAVLTVLVVWVGAVACGGGPPVAKVPEPPAPEPTLGTAPWTELTSEHFTVWTDADPVRVGDLVKRIEYLRHMIASVMYPTVPTAGRALAIVLRDDQELIESNNDRVAWPFLAGYGSFRQPTLVVSLSSADAADVARELPDLVSQTLVRNQPRWLALGMTRSFESMSIMPDGTVVVGTSGLPHMPAGEPPRWVPARELFTWIPLWSDVDERWRELSASALFAYLYDEHPDELGRFVWGLGHPTPWGGSQLEQLRAWTEAFRAMPLEDVDAKVQAWMAHGRRRERRFQVARLDVPMITRQLSRADTHAVRAYLLGGPTDAQKLRGAAELAAALAAEPLNVLAWMDKSTYEPPSLETAQAIAAASPEDWRAWVLLRTALSRAQAEPSQIEQAHANVCRLAAENQALTVNVGWCAPGQDATQP